MAPVPNPRVNYTKIPTHYPVAGEHLVYEPDVETIDLDNVPLNGGVLVKTLYLSVDPYMRNRMRDPSIPSYAPALDLGQPGAGGGIVKVVRSESPKYKVGDHLSTFLSWRTYQVLPEAGAGEILENPFNLPWSAFTGVAGMPGETAFYSTHLYGKFKKGETIFISTAAGAVGSLVGQLAKLAGLKVIGSAGDENKIKFLKEELGFDVVFNYKKESVWDVLKANGPIDVYFDNVGGEQLDAALLNAAPLGSRFILCGYASEYNVPKDSPERYGIKHMDKVLAKAITINGFLVAKAKPEVGPELFVKEFLPLLRDKKLKYREAKTVGLENLPQALIGVLKGDNQGKGVVLVSED